jgi:hypothetical protein
VRGDGSAYIVFGRTRTALDLARIGHRGIRIPGPVHRRVPGAGLSTAVAGIPGAGGEGRDGVLVGSPYVERDGLSAVGSATLYVSR